MTDIGPTGDK